jgi:hypothetical protein
MPPYSRSPSDEVNEDENDNENGNESENENVNVNENDNDDEIVIERIDFVRSEGPHERREGAGGVAAHLHEHQVIELDEPGVVLQVGTRRAALRVKVVVQLPPLVPQLHIESQT